MTQQLDMRALIAQQDTEPDTYARYRVVPLDYPSEGLTYRYQVFDVLCSLWVDDGTHVAFTQAEAVTLAGRLNEVRGFTHGERYI